MVFMYVTITHGYDIDGDVAFSVKGEFTYVDTDEVHHMCKDVIKAIEKGDVRHVKNIDAIRKLVFDWATRYSCTTKVKVFINPF